MGRGSLRIYLGAAPGVGKTVAMLDEAHRRLERGTDVVVGYVETHGRPHTAALLEGLEVLPRREVTRRGAVLTELDTAAVLARRPEVVLVDELAHTIVPASPEGPGVAGDSSVPGELERCRASRVGRARPPGATRNAGRTSSELLEAGIDVISTVNIQHLESLNDVATAITGVRQRETVPDEVVRRAEQVQLVDMSPEALRRRMAHGNVYGPDTVDAALANYFRVGNLSALREIALLWLADRVDEALERYRADQGIHDAWPARERVVVALTGGPGSETLLRRGARIATRAAGGDLIACHVRAADGLTATDPAELSRLRGLDERPRGRVPRGVGARRRRRRPRPRPRGQRHPDRRRRQPARPLADRPCDRASPPRCADDSGDIDVHLVSHEASRVDRRGRRPAAAAACVGWPPASRSPSSRSSA